MIMDQKTNARVEERNSLIVRNRGELIAAARKKLGYSQEELELRSGVSRTQISRIERGITSPTIETIRKLEEGLDVPLMDLYVNPGNACPENQLQVKKRAALISQFEEELARKQLSASELEAILERALTEIREKEDGR